MASMNSITIQKLRDMKEKGEKFTCLTAYDSSFATLLSESGVEVLLVGDSLGMVVQGRDSTVPVTLDEMVYHSAAVARGNRGALLMVDMPFLAAATVEQAIASSARLMKEGGAQIVKLEGGRVNLKVITALTSQGVPVCAHLGLLPQSVHKMGGYRVQGKDEHAADQILQEALAVEEAGADMLLLECVPALLADRISENVSIPVIGIGAGAATDGQVLVIYDMLGITPGKRPKFSKDFLQGKATIAEAVASYVADVKSGAFPAEEHTF